MNKRSFLFPLIVLALAVGVGIGWRLGGGDESTATTTNAAPAERKVLYWYDPMKPDAHFEQPGKSPFMDMDLVPRYADEESAGAAAEGFGLSPAFTQNLGVQLGTVEEGTLQGAIEATGNVAFDGHAVAVAQARTNGIVERAWPLAVGDRVRAGAPLAQVRVPTWYAAQQEYLALRDDAELAAAARARLLQLGMSAEQIATLTQRGEAMAVVTIVAPRAGMLSEFNLRQGMTVAAGQTLARINGIERVWIEARIPEAGAAQLVEGGKATATLPALPGRTLQGRIDALIPELDAATRTVRARLTFPNPQGVLKPGMSAFVRLEKAGASPPRLLVPTEAVLSTGKRQLVIASPEDGRFVPVEVTLGQEANGKTELLAGELRAGDRVVVSGQFMMDSEASLRGVLARMRTQEGEPATQAQNPTTHVTTGVVRAVDAEEITLAHEPVPTLQWPAMTMPFALARPELGQGLRPGQKVRVHFSQRDGEAVIEQVEIVAAEDKS